MCRLRGGKIISTSRPELPAEALADLVIQRKAMTIPTETARLMVLRQHKNPTGEDAGGGDRQARAAQAAPHIQTAKANACDVSAYPSALRRTVDVERRLLCTLPAEAVCTRSER